MSPSAADLSAPSAVDPLAAITAPATKRAAAGFQEHLERARQAAVAPPPVDRDPPARSTRPESKSGKPADDRDRAPRNEAPTTKRAPTAKRSEAPRADESEPTAETEQPAATDDGSAADEPSTSAAEQAAGQAQADATAKPAETTAPEEAIAVAEEKLAAELAKTGSQTQTPETPQPEAPQPTAVVEPTPAVEQPVTSQGESSPVTLAPNENAVAEAAVDAAKVKTQAAAAGKVEEKNAQPAELAVAPTAEAAKTAKSQAVAETKDTKSDDDDTKTNEATDQAGPDVATTAAATTTVDPNAAVRQDAPQVERPAADDKPKENAPAASDSKPATQEATRLDAAARTPAAPAASTTRALAAGGGEGSTNLSQVERTRLVQRVAKAVQTAHDRGGELKLRLNPPELGSIKLEVKLHEGVMQARIETETRDAQRVLSENLLVLRERLAEQNIKVERFDVDVFNPVQGGGGNAADLAQQQGDGQGDSGRRNGSGSGPRDGVGLAETRTTDVRPPAVSTDGRINVVV